MAWQSHKDRYMLLKISQTLQYVPNTNQHEMPNQQQNPGSSKELLLRGEMQLPNAAASVMAASDQPEELDHEGPPALL
jgi:hypothetical protein